MRYRAVLLDVYGTLVHDDDAAVTAVCARVGALTGADPADVEREWGDRLWAAAEPAHGPGFRTLADLNLSSLAATAAHFGAPVDPAGLCRDQMAFWRRAPLFADARAFLATAGVPVCLVSDADRADLTALLEHHGLAPAAVVTSEDARAYKPRPEPFREALARLGAEPGEVVHIGDSVTADVAGAAALEIATVHLVRPGRRTGAGAVSPRARPDYVVASLAELRFGA